MVGLKVVSFLFILNVCHALDLQFDRIVCDDSLPAYAWDGALTVTCSGSNRCTFGDLAMISGVLQYQDLEAVGLHNNTGYASANLQLMTLDYELFQFLPFNFCGSFIKKSAYNFNKCPENGQYHFEVPYQLPPNNDPTSAWFATGWRGVSYLQINAGYDESSPLLAHCKLEFETFVTQSQESGWATLPSAAQTTIALVGIVLFMAFIVCCLACQPREKHITDDVYENKFKAMEDNAERDARRRAQSKANGAYPLDSQSAKDWLPPSDVDWDPESTKAKAHQISLKLKENSRSSSTPVI